MDLFKFDPTVLAVFVLGTCLACMWMVFFFGRRLQTSASLRDSLIEGAKQQELRLPIRELHDRAIAGPLDPKNPPPEGYGPTRRLWEPEAYAGTESIFDPWGAPRSNESPEEKEERRKREEERRQQLREFKKWESEEKVRYESQRQKAEMEASKRAEKKIPKSIDIALLGGGWAFLLEFSTVIVIVFALLILGILDTIEGKDIVTILAAIAGYVLGKATAATTQQERSTSEGSPGTQKPA